MKVSIRTHLREASNVQSMSPIKKFKVILIREGLGNLRDCFYYTRLALQDAVENGVFEGKKCFADHPSLMEEKVQPERSTKDILGYFENVTFEEDEQGRGFIGGELCVPLNHANEWALSLLTNSIEYAKKYKDADFVGLSINANGEADQVSLDEFMKQTLPESVMSKLQLAQSEGIELIRPVSRLTEAVSCDLVTEAGAGGRILSMIEGNRMKHEKKEKEKKEAAPPAPEQKDQGSDGKAHETHQDGGNAGAGKDQGHDDEDQDKALFAKMIKQYLGEDHEVDEAGMQMAKHAYEAHKEDGMEHEAAYEAAGKHLKMALAIGKKMAGHKQAEGESESEAHESESEMEKKEAAKCNPKDNMESNTKVISLNAKIAKLEEQLKTFQLRDYLDTKMAESKRPVSFTKKFREALGSPKSKSHIDDTFKIFVKAFEAGSEVVESDGFIFTEKQQSIQTQESKGAIGSMADCLAE